LSWQVRWQAAARRDLSRLDPQVQERVITAVERLAVASVGDVLRLKGVTPPEWRLRVGQWRIRFRRNDAEQILDILRVLPRDQAY
jgi:mRNA-degrading endonuclease RelE of RelBE toxin-antitoxin system